MGARTTTLLPRSSVTLVWEGGSGDRIGEPTGMEPEATERWLATAGGQERA